MAYQSRLELTIDARSGERRLKSLDQSLGRVEKRGTQTGKSVKGVTKSVGGMATAIKGFIGLAAGSAFVAMAKGSLEAAAATKNYADALGISTERLTSLEYAAERAGVNSGKLRDILKDTADKIGDAFANEGGEAIDAIENLGLSAERLANLSPDEQLLAIAEQIDNVGTRAEKIQILESLASDASLLLPLLEDNAKGFRELSTEAVENGRVLSTEAAEGAKEAKGALLDLGDYISTSFTEIIGRNGDNIADMALMFTDAADEVEKAGRDLADGDDFQRFGEDTVEIFAVVADTARASAITISSAFSLAGKSIGALWALVGEVGDEFTSSFLTVGKTADYSGAAAVIEGYKEDVAGIHDTILNFETDLHRTRLENIRERRQAEEEAVSSMSGLPSRDRPLAAIGRDGGGDTADKEDTTAQDEQTEATKRATEAQFDYNGAMNEAIIDAARIEDLHQRNQEELTQLLGKYDEGQARLNEYNTAQEELARLYDAGLISQSQFTESLGMVMNEYDGLTGKAKESATLVDEFWSEAANNMQRTMSNQFFSIMQGDFDNMAGSFKKTIDQMVADLLASQLLEYVSGAWSGASSGGGGFADTIGSFASSLFGGMFGGARADGGPVTAGTPYLVGERGPEIVVPKSSGTVLPNGTGTGGSITINQNFSGVRDAQGVRQAGSRAAADAARALRHAQRNM